MKRTASLLAALLAVCALHGQSSDNATLPLKLGETWQVFLNVEPPASYDAVPASLKTPEGKPVAAKITTLKDAAVDLAALNGGFQAGGFAILYNEFHAEKAGVMRAGAGADWWMEIHVNGKAVCSTMANGNGSGAFQPADHPFSFPVVAGKNLLAAKVKSGTGGWRFACGTPAAPQPNVKFEANNEWKVADMSDLLVKAGSALDQSSLAEIPRTSCLLGLGASKRLPRLGIGPTGRLVAESRPDVPVRLRGTGINYAWFLGKLRREAKDWKLAMETQVITAKRQGYNMLRTSPDVGGEKKSFLPDNLDRSDYLLAKLGEHGVYCLLDCFVDMRRPWEAGDSRMACGLRMYLGDEIVRASWKSATEFTMNHVNPYTGLARKDDPTIACAILYNEQEWGFFHPKAKLDLQTQAEFDVKFRQWLERKYQTPSALAKAWGDKTLKSFAAVAVPDSFPVGGYKASDNDFLLFCGELSHETAAWMRETLRSTGYQGLIAQYNISHWLEGQEARWEESPVSIANTYHNHPTDFDRPGSKCGQDSSIGAGAWYWRGVASMRFADRPFIVTEFNHSFWNPYQYECGPLFSAYSALQGFDAVSIHACAAFIVNGPQLSVFDAGKSPVSRAGEFLAGCFYLRGDVKASPRRIELQIPKDYLETKCNGGRTVSPEQGKLAFMSGFSVAFPWAKPAPGVGVPAAPDFAVEPVEGAGFKAAGDGGAINTVDSQSSKFSLDTVVAGLKAKGILPKDNLSDPAKGVFQSDTGEITMRTKENLLKVATPRSEAVTLESGKGESVGQLEVVNTSAPSLVAACAVDQAPLAASKRVVLIYSTHAVNSGMELSADHTTLVKLGAPPVLIRTGKLDVKLKSANGAAMSLYALGFDGSRRERLPLTFKDGVLTVSIDTAALKDGPTPFFDLVVEN